MQMSEMKQHMDRIEQWLSQAAHACEASDHVPQDLRNCITELDRRSHEAVRMMETDEDEQHVREWVTRLEALGDRAMSACRRAGEMDGEMSQAIQQAHDELSQLKHQLH
ncbi:hypothetical protein OOT46_20725 [Aquabacterium sp. A7-Y]|uniref:hypothetical protein n=1 Tax=Aquabacterium sp. A7-Y TaxID=1349605 RepID=UPI00223E804B|nr:hypothetical protein [Aquabacterium sp. A7-Y]MCW7540262.1 hypothetical protein [Aquabacterium sp. A7-Y]